MSPKVRLPKKRRIIDKRKKKPMIRPIAKNPYQMTGSPTRVFESLKKLNKVPLVGTRRGPTGERIFVYELPELPLIRTPAKEMFFGGKTKSNSHKTDPHWIEKKKNRRKKKRIIIKRNSKKTTP